MQSSEMKKLETKDITGQESGYLFLVYIYWTIIAYSVISRMYTGYILLVVSGCLGFIVLILSVAYVFVTWREKSNPRPSHTKPNNMDSDTKPTIGEIKPTARERSESRVFPWLTTIEFNKDKLAMAKAKKYNRDNWFWQLHEHTKILRLIFIYISLLVQQIYLKEMQGDLLFMI